MDNYINLYIQREADTWFHNLIVSLRRKAGYSDEFCWNRFKDMALYY